MKIVRSEEMREMDRSAIEEYGIPEIILMENAAEAAYQLIRLKKKLYDNTIILFAGPGNNGGDALALARLLYARGALPLICYFSENGSPLYNRQFEIIRNLPIETILFSTQMEEILDDSGLIVDGLFGTGLSREIEGNYRIAINLINNSEKPVISLDIPSGIQGNNGQIMGSAVNADYTITFGLPKRGNLLYPGYINNGELYLTSLSFPPDLVEKQNEELQLFLPPPLPKRNPDGHKGNFGKILIIAGAGQYGGAPALAASASLKSGAGYVYLAVPASLLPTMQTLVSEAVLIPLPETEEQTIAEEALHQLLDTASSCSAVVIGPGTGRNDETDLFIQQFIEECPVPVIIDGDGISAVSGFSQLVKSREPETILTPHSGEASRLIDFSVPEINSRRIEAVQEISRNYSAYTVLKGAHSLISTPDEKVCMNPSGNSGMATPGSGDVLSGMIAGLIAGNNDLAETLKTAVFLHGLAGDLYKEKYNEESLTAGELIRFIPKAIRYYKSNYPDIIKNNYGKIKLI